MGVPTTRWSIHVFVNSVSLASPVLIVFRERVSRLALRPFTFIFQRRNHPRGYALVSLSTRPIHMDEDLYPNAENFDGYRFLKLREEGSNKAAKHQMVTASTELLSFGFGRHAWWVFLLFTASPNAAYHTSIDSPGRYFATYQLKALLAACPYHT